MTFALRWMIQITGEIEIVAYVRQFPGCRQDRPATPILFTDPVLWPHSHRQPKILDLSVDASDGDSRFPQFADRDRFSQKPVNGATASAIKRGDFVESAFRKKALA